MLGAAEVRVVLFSSSCDGGMADTACYYTACYYTRGKGIRKKITEIKMRLLLRTRLRRPGGAKRAARPGG